MRLNKFVATATGKSRREADLLIASGRVRIDKNIASIGNQVPANTAVYLDNKVLHLPAESTVVMLNKPVGYVSSRRAQARDAQTLYELLPPELHQLKTVGRLDQNSSGLILLTDDGDFAFRMTHPKFVKVKVYEIQLDRPLAPLHQQMISDVGIDLEDGTSKLLLEGLDDRRLTWRVTMSEGRNRQIRRTFRALGYTVVKLHRTHFGNVTLGSLKPGQWKKLDKVI
ncbi:MAG TPA: pseudouridine synthase [Candidatus Nanoperiomorbaceae bacterium]|nr:pseudouridine synthase [Candidatus Nanoperiomorbaceae bacterium]HMQ96541.1 pseudouridine synthase [Candidatus Nanoperiomorbaceae bacterium]HMR86081.1 pseudouridine synthase [Candidatus Nanoperiomorbaceae bacterium]HMU11942.1 pseudouridine synthase [Candidatus Nanoperiomorbaceae bacterium]